MWYGITFDTAGSWSFDNDTSRNFVIFGVDNSSSYHSDNRKYNFSILIETLVHQRKNLVLTLVKQAQNFVWVYIKMMIIVSFLMEKKSLNLKLVLKMLTF